MDCGVSFYDKQNVSVTVRHDNDSDVYTLCTVLYRAELYSTVFSGRESLLERRVGSSRFWPALVSSDREQLCVLTVITQDYNGCVVSLYNNIDIQHRNKTTVSHRYRH